MKTITNLVLTLILSGDIYIISSALAPQALASNENHVHKHHNDEDGHDETDSDDHGEDHSKESDSHDDHGHESHEKEDSHDDHGHGGEDGDDHSSHGEHEENQTKIDPDAAKAAGIITREVGPATIKQVLTLTGRVTLNRNTTAMIHARFPGIVKKINVKWGDEVRQGQSLAVIEANESLKNYTVIAPFDGVVLTRNTNIGKLADDEAIFTIADLTEVWAEFHVFPRDLGKVNTGQYVRVHTLENINQPGGKEIKAPITLILPTADPLSQTVIAVVSIPNTEGLWRPGMTVEGDVHIREIQVPLAVNEAAVQRMENKTVVFVKEGDSYEMRPVKLGKSDGTYVEVREGLKPGEEYVSEGSFIVKADIGKASAEHEH